MNRGLKIHYRNISSLTPTKNIDEYLLFYKDKKKTLEQISKFSKHDASVYEDYENYLQKFCSFW